jgi:hypothetical protein
VIGNASHFHRSHCSSRTASATRTAAALDAAQETKRNEDSSGTAFQGHAAPIFADWDEKIFPEKFTAIRSESLTEW